jgi:hypothetical protein
MKMYVHIYTYICIYMCVYTCPYVRVFKKTPIFICMYIYIYIYVHIFIFICTFVCIYASIHGNMHIFMNIYVGRLQSLLVRPDKWMCTTSVLGIVRCLRHLFSEEPSYNLNNSIFDRISSDQVCKLFLFYVCIC